LFGLLFDPEGGSRIFRRKVGTPLQDYTAWLATR
jgi:hypothetical protein